MDNRRATEEETGWNQEYRDRAIAERWGVQTPYVLFSRHRFLDGMPIALNTRSNEMLLPTQIQRSLFYLTEISDAEAEQSPIPSHYHLQTKPWNITVPEETKQDFLKHGETEIYNTIMMG
jgi:magnesium-dependent phosphatase 1